MKKKLIFMLLLISGCTGSNPNEIFDDNHKLIEKRYTDKNGRKIVLKYFYSKDDTLKREKFVDDRLVLKDSFFASNEFEREYYSNRGDLLKTSQVFNGRTVKTNYFKTGDLAIYSSIGFDTKGKIISNDHMKSMYLSYVSKGDRVYIKPIGYSVEKDKIDSISIVLFKSFDSFNDGNTSQVIATSKFSSNDEIFVEMKKEYFYRGVLRGYMLAYHTENFGKNDKMVVIQRFPIQISNPNKVPENNLAPFW